MTDDNSPKQTDGNWTRRTVLKVAGAGAALPFVGVASAKGRGKAKGRGNSGTETCCESGTILAKYEVSGGEFEFEKGRDSLNIDGSEITLTITGTKEDGEILAFDWDSDIYDVTSVCVKAGPDTYSFDPDDSGTAGSVDVCNAQEGIPGPCHAVSNVVFCKDVFWQLDFGGGPTEAPPIYDKRDPDPDPALYMAAISHPFDNPFYLGPDIPSSLEFSEQFELSLSGAQSDATAASLTFTLGEDFPEQGVHLSAWEMPGPFTNTKLEYQVLFDDATTAGTGTHTLSVDLPPSE